MCEILVCVKDRGNTGNLSWDSKAPKQGDVISVQSNGWNWGTHEQGITVCPKNGNHSFFRIIKLPNISFAAAATMLAPETDVDPAKPSPYLQYRAYFLDKTKIPAGALATHWNDDTRAAPFITLNYTAAQLAALKTKRTPVPF